VREFEFGTYMDINIVKGKPLIAVERFVQKARNISDYSYTKIAISIGFTSSTDYTYMPNQIKPAPEKLKRAMFRTSSRGIATALQKK
tara:strand:+ start:237 stop:497 length:261 start_codon:yes stop_codon:yes gene_type:complete